MSDSADQFQICPHCGQENAIHSLKCIRCGEMLEDMFIIEGLEDKIEQEGVKEEFSPETMSLVLDSLENHPLLEDAKTDQEDQSLLEEEEALEDPRREATEDVPDWLERVRQRAREEEAGGELAKGVQAMDAKREAEGRAQVDQAFDDMLQRIRDEAERERQKARRTNAELVDKNGDPEWLKRIRELNIEREDDTQQLHSSASGGDELDREWTEEELRELLRREIGAQYIEEQALEDLTPFSQPEPEISQDEDEPEAVAEAEAAEIDPNEFHNIPEDDFDILPILNRVSEEQSTPGEQITEEETVEETKTTEEVEELEAEEPDAFQDDPSDSVETVSEEALQDEEPCEEIEPEAEQAPDEGQAETEAEMGLEEKGAADEVDVEEPAVEEAKDLIVPAVEDEQESPTEAEPTEEFLADLILLRDQRERAQVLSNIIEQEGRRTLSVLHEKKPQGKLGRLILALLLIAGIVIALILGPAQGISMPKSPAAALFNEKISGLKSGDSVLVVLDYQAASSTEIEALSRPILKALRENGVGIRLVTAQPNNLWLASALFDESAEMPEVEFVPGGILGYLAFGVGTKPDWGATPIEKTFRNGREIFSKSDHILLVSDSFEFLRSWLEQIAPWQAEIPVSAISTGTNSAVLLPYFESDQLQGYLAGLSDSPDQIAHQRAWQVGMLLMMIALILGIITKLDVDATHREEKRDAEA